MLEGPPMKNPESDKKTALVQNKYIDSQQNIFKTQIFYHESSGQELNLGTVLRDKLQVEGYLKHTVMEYPEYLE